MIDGEPVKNEKFLIVPGKKIFEWSDNFIKKITISENKEASIVFIIISDNQFNISVESKAENAAEYDIEHYFNAKHIPYFFVSELVANKRLFFK